MADTIYFPDGTHEVLIGPQAFENVIFTRLGTDAFNWYLQSKEYEELDKKKLSQAIEDTEMEVEHYRFMCIDARDEIDSAIELILNSKRLNKEKLLNILQNAREELDRNL